MTEQQTAPPIPPRQRRRANKGRKRHKPEDTVQAIDRPEPKADQPSAIPRPISRDKLISSKGLDKTRIVRLLLAGASPKAISEKIDIGVNQCQNLIKEIDKDISGLGWKDYLSVLLSKLRLILDNHTQNSADIQLLLLSVDQAIEANDSAIKAIGDSNKQEKEHLQAIAGRLRKERLELMRELNTNNLALTTNLSKMGVTTRPPSLENKVPTQSSTPAGFTELSEIPVGYEKMDRAELVEGLAESNRAVNRYLRAEREKQRSSE